jgi:hypothetical protein
VLLPLDGHIAFLSPRKDQARKFDVLNACDAFLPFLMLTVQDDGPAWTKFSVNVDFSVEQRKSSIVFSECFSCPPKHQVTSNEIAVVTPARLLQLASGRSLFDKLQAL